MSSVTVDRHIHSHACTSVFSHKWVKYNTQTKQCPFFLTPITMRIHLLFLLISLPSTLCIFMNISTSSNYKTIFSFGDSLADTGNYLTYGREAILAIDKSPYGITYFHRPTGRCSDGRLVVDFIGNPVYNFEWPTFIIHIIKWLLISVTSLYVAEAFGVPELPPYLATVEGQNLRHGVNFAVAGATALDTSFFYERGLDAFLWTNSSLSIQLGWFKKLKPSICKQATGLVYNPINLPLQLNCGSSLVWFSGSFKKGKKKMLKKMLFLYLIVSSSFLQQIAPNFSESLFSSWERLEAMTITSPS